MGPSSLDWSDYPQRSVVYSPDGRQIISGSEDCTIRIWDAESGAAGCNLLDGHIRFVQSVAYSPDGRHIISGSSDCLQIWNAESGARVGRLLSVYLRERFPQSVACSPDGRHIVSGSSDRTIRIWNVESDAVRELHRRHTDWVQSVAYSPDGRHITSGSRDCTIRIWDAESGAAVSNPLKGHTSSVQCVAYSPDGRHIISGSDDCTIRIWDAESGATVGKHLKKHGYRMQSVAHSPDVKHIVSGSYDTTTCVLGASPYVSTQPSSCNPTHDTFRAKPDLDGWVRDSDGGLLYWVPHDYRTGLHSPALLTIPLTSRIRSASLDFDAFVFGTSWTQIFERTSS